MTGTANIPGQTSPGEGGRPRAAMVREVSPRLAEAELTFLDRTPVDLDLARAQHAGYRELLAELGLEVVDAPPAPDLPDGVFVEDAAVVIDDVAVLTRPGAPSRRPEVATLRPLLTDRGLQLVELTAPGTLDGGDVLQIDRTVYVGRSSRTDDDGIRQLRDVVTATGRELVVVEVSGALHLKTAATALPDGTVLAVPGWLDVGAFGDREVVAVPEPTGANLLLVGDTVVVSASAPRTAELVAGRGWTVRTVEIGELERVEAGLTCLSVLLP